LFRPRSEEPPEVETACRLRLLLRLLLRLIAGALRASCDRGRRLFLSNKFSFLLPEGIRHLAAGVAEVELQDRLSDIVVSAE
jgi:hypothetical protein